MSGKLLSNTVVEKYAKFDRNVSITTVVRANESKMKPDDIKKLADGLLKKNPNKKLMVKVLTGNGYITLKHFDQSTDVILGEDVYLNGNENVNAKEYASIYKASFYIL